MEMIYVISYGNDSVSNGVSISMIKDDLHDTTIPIIPDIFRFALIIYLPVVFIIGSVGNFLVIWIFCRTRYLRTPPNMLIINLAVSDLLMILTQFPVVFVSAFKRQWIFGDLGCNIFAFCGALFGITSISSLTAIAIDRKHALCNTDVLYKTSRSRAVSMVTAVWTYSCCWATLPVFGIGDYVLEGFGVSCAFEYMDTSLNTRLYVLFLMTGCFAIPVSIIIICYGLIAHKVRKSRQCLLALSKNNATLYRKKLRVDLQIAKLGSSLTIFFILAWTPYAAVAFTGQFINSSRVTFMARAVPCIFAKSSACWNPILYAIVHRRFRRAIKTFFLSLFGISRGHSGRSTMSRSNKIRSYST